MRATLFDQNQLLTGGKRYHVCSCCEMTYLHRREAKDGDSDIAVTGVLDPLRLTSKLKTGPPASHPNCISRYLAENMKIKPCGFRRLKSPQVPRNDSSSWKQNAPTHDIQYSMNLTPKKIQIKFNNWSKTHRIY